MRHAGLFLAAVLTCATAAAQTSARRTIGRETDTETIWTGRYSNCDYGYYVTLPSGIVGHGSKAPNPNHGVAINPAAPKSITVFKVDESNRYIDVFSFYDVEDHEDSTSATLDYYLSLGEIGSEKNVDRLGLRSFSLAWLSAKRAEDRWTENSTVIRRDRVIAYRRSGGILYQITLQSPESTYAHDEKLFELIIAGFHLTKLPNGQCSND